MRITMHACKSKNKFPFNLFSLAIMFLQRDYSHFALEYTAATGSQKVIDSSAMSVRDRLKSKFDKEYEIIRSWDFDVNLDDIEFYRWMEKLENVRYGFLHILGLTLDVLSIVNANPFRDGVKTLICNELVLLFMQRFMGVRVGDPEDYDLNATEDLIEEIFQEKLDTEASPHKVIG